jgi:serine/threonine protein phosphatase PrpC
VPWEMKTGGTPRKGAAHNMIAHICSGTDPGLARSNNEDSVAFDAATGLCILADGMGGHNAGEVASGMATAFIKSELRKWIAQTGKSATPAELEAALLQCVASANSAIYNMSRSSPQYAGMGTTLVVGVFHGNSLVLGHIGDSRCYRLRDGQLQQITKDHSILQEQVDTGLILEAYASFPMNQNIVTRALGVDDHVQTELNRHDVMPNDVYLMCSDGLSDMLSDAAIAGILLAGDSLEEKTGRFILAANDAGGRDNISVLLAQIGDASKKAGLLSSARRAIQGVWPGSRRH